LHDCNRTPITNLLDKGTSTAIYHENEWRRPRFHFPSFSHGPGGITLAGINAGLAKIGIRIVKVCGNGSTVRGHTKERLPVIISLFAEQTVRNLQEKA
jgi:hypothetical protein